MYALRSIGVLSCARTMGALYGCLALLLVPFLLLGGVANLLLGHESGSISGVAMMAFAIIVPVFYAFMGFLLGALVAWLYNFVARKVGGIELELKATASAAPLSN